MSRDAYHTSVLGIDGIQLSFSSLVAVTLAVNPFLLLDRLRPIRAGGADPADQPFKPAS